MTKRKLFISFTISSAVYFAAVILGITIRIFDCSDGAIIYETYKDMIPFIIAIPAAWLGYSLQRRASYLQQLRILWSKLIDAIQTAHQYTYIESPTFDQYSDTLRTISIAIDEVRGVFMNLGEKPDHVGLYPYEPIKDIHVMISKLGYNKAIPEKERNETKDKIFKLWGDMRRDLLREFDRAEPTFPHSHWVQLEKRELYESHDIERTPS